MVYSLRICGKSGYFSIQLPFEYRMDHRASNLLTKDGITYSIKDKGVIRITEDDEVNEISFIVDGMVFTSEEFCQLFGGYNGFDIHFQIHDASDDIPGENEYLVPIKITRESLLKELESYINIWRLWIY